MCTETVPSVFPDAVLFALVPLGGLVWVAGVAYFMPYFEHRWNRLHLASAVSFLFLGCCLVLSELYLDTDAATTAYFGTPLAAVLGIFLADWRAHWVFTKPSSLLASPYEVEYKARQMLHEAVWGHPTGKLNRSAAVAQDSAAPGTAVAAGGAATRGAAADAQRKGPAGPTLDDADGMDDNDSRLLAAQKLIPGRVFAEAHAVFSSGLSRFRASSVIHVFVSRFYQLQGNRHMQMSHLLQAERRHPFLDVAFTVFQMRRSEDEAQSNEGFGGISALSRVTFDRFAAEGTCAQARARVSDCGPRFARTAHGAPRATRRVP